MKKIIISELEHTSKLGRSVLKNVPVWVDENLVHKFNPSKDGYSLDGDTIFYLEREVAKTWLRNFVTNNKQMITSDEMHGMQLAMSLNMTQMAKLLGLTKGTITKIYQGTQPIQKPWAFLCIERLKAFLHGPDLRSLQNSDLEDSDSVSADSVANYILYLNRSDECDPISNLKLNKLLYYAQGIFLGIFNKPLFAEPVLAYKHGPVVHSIYKKYKGERDIKGPNTIDIEQFSHAQIRVMEITFAHFGQYTASRLLSMTHNESPWLDTPQSQKIPLKAMQDFFSAQIANQAIDSML